jgi:hypothetical protein
MPLGKNYVTFNLFSTPTYTGVYTYIRCVGLSFTVKNLVNKTEHSSLFLCTVSDLHAKSGIILSTGT